MTPIPASVIYPALRDPLTPGDLQQLFSPSFDERRWATTVVRAAESQVASIQLARTVKVLIVDEIHHLIAGSAQDRMSRFLSIYCPTGSTKVPPRYHCPVALSRCRHTTAHPF